MKVSTAITYRKIEVIQINWTFECKINYLETILVKWSAVHNLKLRHSTIWDRCRYQELVEEKVHKDSKEATIRDMDQITKANCSKTLKSGSMEIKTNHLIKAIHLMTSALNVSNHRHSGSQLIMVFSSVLIVQAHIEALVFK